MAGANGDALEWALALLRAPGERHALRRQPLPHGILRLLAVAGRSSSESIAEAVRDFSESESRLCEAARFYVREVLFHPQANAYRVLGVARDASSDQIKAHHRLLQHWLHPDRLQSEEDAVFAARVNSAWNHLRTEERRRAYDQALQDKDVDPATDLGSGSRRAPIWRVSENAIPASDRWRRRVPAMGLAVACAVLGWMIVLDGDRRPDRWQSDGAGQGGNAVNPESSFLEDLIGGVPKREQPPAKPEMANASPGGPTRSFVGPSLAGGATQEVRTIGAMPELQPVPASITRVMNQILDQAVPLSDPVPRPSIEASVPSATAASMPTPIVESPKSTAPAVRREFPAVDFNRIQLARHTGDQLLHYLRRPSEAPPPIWNSPAILSVAQRMREELHDHGQVRLTEPRWRVGDTTAAVSSAWLVEGPNTDGGGRVTADLIWRENRWLVTGLSMEHSQ